MDAVQKDVWGWVAIAAIGVGVAWYLKNEAEAAASALDPLNPNNVAAQASNAVTEFVSGGTETSTGVGIYDLLHVFVKKPDGTIEEYNKLDPVLAWGLAFDGWVQTDAAGNPLPSS